MVFVLSGKPTKCLKYRTILPLQTWLQLGYKFSQNTFPVYFRVSIFIAYYEGHMSHGIFNFKIYLIWMCRTAQVLVTEFQEKYLETQPYTAIKVLKSIFIFVLIAWHFHQLCTLANLYAWVYIFSYLLGKCHLSVSCFHKHFSECLLTFQVNVYVKEKSLAIHDEADVAQC